MRRAALLAVVVVAGCGGGGPSPAPVSSPAPAPDRGLGFAPDLRTADARSPLVPAGDGAWRCPTEGSLQLAVSAQGEVAASVPGRMLASVSATRALVNRACDRLDQRGGARSGRRHGRVGAGIVRCRVPAVVIVDFAGGDVAV